MENTLSGAIESFNVEDWLLRYICGGCAQSQASNVSRVDLFSDGQWGIV